MATSWTVELFLVWNHLREGENMKHSAICYIPKLDGTGRVLGVLNPHYAAWSFPGGKVEGGEMLQDAARRELREETGITEIRRFEWLMSAKGTADPEFMVHVFRVDTVQEPRTMEVGNTVAWITEHMLEQSAAFGPFYKKFFAGRRWRYQG